MQGYLNKGKEILKILINNGFEAYFFGETVRNSLIGLDCDEVKIITNASGNELNQIFKDNDCKIINSLFTKIVIDNYVFLFSTYSDNYSQPSYTLEVKKISNRLLDNLTREAFTIDSLAMSMSGKIVDSYNGYKDIKKKVIKTIESSKQTFYEDPIKMLHALVILSELNYSLSSQVEAGIKKRVKLLAEFEKNEKKAIGNEMKRIVNGRFGRKALAYFLQFGISKVLTFYEKTLRKFISNGKGLNYDDFLACCFIQNGEVDDDYLTTADDPYYVMNVYNLDSANETSEFDALTIFTYGIDLCLKGLHLNRILGRTKKNLEKKIIKQYDMLPVKKKCDLAFKGEDIMRISDLRDANKIGDLFEDIAYQVISGNLPNDYKRLEDYACIKLKEMGITYDVSRTMIKGTGNPDRIKKSENELDDYAKFISGLNNGPTKASYWKEGLDEEKDPSFFDLPEPKTRTVPLYADDNDYVDNEDKIDYSNYKDPEIPNFDKPNIENQKVKEKNYNEFPFESEFGDEEEDDDVTYIYEHKVDEETNERIRNLEQRLNEQDRIIKNRNVNDKKVLALTNRVVDGIMENLNEDKEISSLINKADFASKVAEFVSDYLEKNLP